jgi:branched-subunit amino acid ABC-type transport system permease component
MRLPEAREILDDPYYLGIERRLTVLSLFLGLGIIFTFLILGKINLACSFALGAFLSYLNFNWMKQGVDRLLNADPALNAPARPSNRRIIVRYFLRYALIGGTLYAIVRVKFLDLKAAFLGLLLFVAAILFECVHQVIKGIVEDRRDGRA